MPEIETNASAKFAPTMPIQFFTFCELAELNVGSPGSYEIRHRNVRTANASNAIATTSLTRECFAPPRFLSSVAPSARQKLRSSSVYVFLQVGQIFIQLLQKPDRKGGLRMCDEFSPPSRSGFR